ncbi:MAG: YbdK family carboxylate-amine ligase [Rubrobacteraceae bacterium]
MKSFKNKSLISENAFETGEPEGTIGAEEELWLADPETLKLGDGAQKILAEVPEDLFSGELIDCEIESNTGVHNEPQGLVSDLVSRRRVLLEHAERLDRILGTSGTHPIGDWREQEIIDKPHYQRLKDKLEWLIRRNNTFSLHVHYAVQGREKAIYVFNRMREYVPHLLALSVSSPFWQNELTDMQSSRILIFSRSIHRAGLPAPLENWDSYKEYVDLVYRTGAIDSLSEVWWDVRPHPGLSTIEVRACDSQIEMWRNEALVSVIAALGDRLAEEYESGETRPIRPGREIEENKWSAQRYGLAGDFIDPEAQEAADTRGVLEALIQDLEDTTGHDLSGAGRILELPTEADRQLEVYKDTGSTREVVRDLADRTRASTD